MSGGSEDAQQVEQGPAVFWDQGFTPMPTHCTRWDCRRDGEAAPLAVNARGFMACTRCRSSYGVLRETPAESQDAMRAEAAAESLAYDHDLTTLAAELAALPTWCEMAAANPGGMIPNTPKPLDGLIHRARALFADAEPKQENVR